jgi:hypothetical protein
MFSPTAYFFREKKRKKSRSGMPEILVYMHGYQDFFTVGNRHYLKKPMANKFWTSGRLPNCPPPGYATDRYISFKKKTKKELSHVTG